MVVVSRTCARVPGPPVFLRVTLKNWEWPGDEANTVLGKTLLLRVIYSIDGIMYAKCLECPSNIIRSGATFTFKEPKTEAEELSVVAVGRQSYAFVIHPNNESLVTCTLADSGESDSVKVAGMPPSNHDHRN